LIFFYWADYSRAAKAGQKSMVPAQRSQQTNQGRIPFLCTPRVPI
jgi:hypothetical protein